MRAPTVLALGLAAAVTLASCAPSRRAPGPATSTTPAPVDPQPATSSSSSSSRPTTNSTTTTTPTAVGSRGLPATDRLERHHPLAEALPHETAHYRIDYSVGPDGRLEVRVTLLAILNNARDLAAYQAQLRQYKAEALAFIQAQGENPAAYVVTWLPAEAGAL